MGAEMSLDDQSCRSVRTTDYQSGYRSEWDYPNWLHSGFCRRRSGL